MILKKDFYFIRHGQTDCNLREKKEKGEHPRETPLNQTGLSQARAVEPIIASLPIKTICASPMVRAQQTKDIVSMRLAAVHHEIEDLGECNSEIWQAMRDHGMYSQLPKEGLARAFIDRVKNGMNQALSKEGPLLIVAHGGVHWALCCLLQIEEHEWATDNCIPIHFFFKEKWHAKKLMEKRWKN